MKSIKKAESDWDRANVSYVNYLAYIAGRRDRYRLTLMDLLYVRNFKGGNSSVHVPEVALKTKLRYWSRLLRKLAQVCNGRKLRDLPSARLEGVRSEATAFLELADSHTSMGISGFRASHASVLLHARFPNVLPILDSRVLKGSGIIKRRRRAEPCDYPALINQVRRALRARRDVTIRELDREFFIRG